MAKHNIEQYYPVIGVLENINETLAVMEELLPSIFVKGISDLYVKKSRKSLFTTNKTGKTQELSSDGRKKLTEMLAIEMELYEFVKVRLMNQYKHLTWGIL